MYTAVVLDQSAVVALTQKMRETVNLEPKFSLDGPEGYPLPHHMTINLGKLDEKLNDEWILRADAVELTVDAFLWCEKIGACAARVTEAFAFDGAGNPYRITSFNDGKSHKHITTCLMPGVKPFKSNALWDDPSKVNIFTFEPVTLEGSVKECA